MIIRSAIMIPKHGIFHKYLVSGRNGLVTGRKNDFTDKKYTITLIKNQSVQSFLKSVKSKIKLLEFVCDRKDVTDFY